MTSQQQLAQLESLPNEILDNIASLAQLRPLLAFAAASRKLYLVAVPHLTRHKGWMASLSMRKGRSHLGLPDLLIAVLEDPRKSQHIVRWRTYTDCDWELFSSKYDGVGSWESRQEQYSRRCQAEKLKLLNVIESSSLIPDAMRVLQFDPLYGPYLPAPVLHALGWFLCHHIEHLQMDFGDNLGDMIDFMQQHRQYQFLPSLRTFTAFAHDTWQHNYLKELTPLLMLPSLVTMELHCTYIETYTEDEAKDMWCKPYACPLSTLILEECWIHPKHLGPLLSSNAKCSDNVLGLQSLVYNVSLGVFHPDYQTPQPFNAATIIAIIRDHAGQSLTFLDLNCHEKSWNYERMFLSPDKSSKPERELNSGRWDMTRDVNLRNGFARLREIVLGPELLVCGWRCPLQQHRRWTRKWGLDTPLRPAKLWPEVESLPLAVLLPETVEVLKLRHFNTTVHELAAPIVLEKLMTHLKTGMASTPKLREVHLMDPRSWLGIFRSTAEFEAAIDEFAKLCEANGVMLARGITPTAREFCNPEHCPNERWGKNCDRCTLFPRII